MEICQTVSFLMLTCLIFRRVAGISLQGKKSFLEVYL